ncbi:hypothetical protein V499_00679 [Pseudogymnoascus sp. VKM F-103]|nr:hypothetical protein V499_00679 [Pseudogymnoascus sp. VKM F-103]
MFAVMWLPQATMATTAIIWFTIYEPFSMNPQLSVTIVLFTLSTRAFVLCRLPDIASYGVPPTLVLIILSPILLDCSPFQGRKVAAAIPLFVCAALFCTMELARGAKALDRLADRWAQGYIHIDDPRARDLTVDGVGDGMTDVESRMSGETLNEPPRMPKTDPERVALDTVHAGQEGSFHYKQHGLGSSESLPLSTSSQSPRTSVFEFLGRIDGNLADGTITSPPRERGPFDGYRLHNYTLQMDPGGHQLHAHQRQTVVY